MAALNLNALFFNHEISFCKVYNVESKDQLEKLLVSNRISFLWSGRNRVFGSVFSGAWETGRKCLQYILMRRTHPLPEIWRRGLRVCRSRRLRMSEN